MNCTGVLGEIRVREHGVSIDRQQFSGRGAVAAQLGVAVGAAQIERPVFAATAERVKMRSASNRIVPPAVFLEVIDIAVVAPAAVVAAGLNVPVRRPNEPAVDFGLCAFMGEAILHPERQGTAERVQTEHRLR